MEIRNPELFLKYYDNVRERTERGVAAVPHSAFDWAPRPGAFSFADLIRHLGAIERYMFAENVAGRPSMYPGHGRELADGPDDVLAFFRRAHAESMEIFRTLTVADLERACVTPGGARLPVWKWLRAMVEHEAHHRGQLYLMLGMVGVSAPALYGLTSEEVRERNGPRV